MIKLILLATLLTGCTTVLPPVDVRDYENNIKRG